MTNPPDIRADVVIIGGALGGMTLACALADSGVSVAVIEARDPAIISDKSMDGRTCAISHGSMQILDRCGAWEGVASKAGAILDIRVSDGDSPFFLHYDHTLIGDTPMGYIVENHHLLRYLFDKAKALKNLTLLAPATYETIEYETGRVSVTLKDGRILHASLLVGSDGKFSKVRELAGIKTHNWSYKQTGIVCNILHEHSHQGVAQERFLPTGPFASLPMHDPHRSSLVWTEKESLAPIFMKMDDDEFLLEIQKRLGNYLGKISLASGRFSYPFSLIHAKEYTAHRLALVGDAAHAIHPIAGQGFNLGIRDVGVLADLIIETQKMGLDIGNPDLLKRYASIRLKDNTLMITITDALVRLFSNNIRPIKSARTLGLGAINTLPVAKKFFMRHAMGLKS